MNRCPPGLSYAIAFLVTMHVRIRHVRLPASHLSLGTAGSCLKLAQGGPKSAVQQFRQLMRGMRTSSAYSKCCRGIAGEPAKTFSL